MPKMTKSEAKKRLMEIKRHSALLLTRGGIDGKYYTVKDFDAIIKITERALNRLK